MNKPGKSVVAFGSCLYPADLLNEKFGNQSLTRLAQELNSAELVGLRQYMLIAGDNIYADATGGLFDPPNPRDKYEASYQRLHQSSFWQALNRVHKIHSIDDHELIDNWEPSANKWQNERLQKIRTLGRRAFLTQTSRRQQAHSEDQLDQQPLYGPHNLNGMPLFVMDTRTERELRQPATIAEANMISAEQFTALERWLIDGSGAASNAAGSACPRFILSGSMLLPRKLAVAESDSPVAGLRSDGWEGYPRTLGMVLGLIAKHQIRNVIFVSGDEHTSCLTSASVGIQGQSPVAIHSLHVSPLYSPYVYGAEKRASFAPNGDGFVMNTPSGQLEVSGINNRFADIGNGFALLRMTDPDPMPSELIFEFYSATPGSRAVREAVPLV
jgi:hypothetical protein